MSGISRTKPRPASTYRIVAVTTKYTSHNAAAINKPPNTHAFHMRASTILLARSGSGGQNVAVSK